jgi:prefoldin subunit 5
MHIHQNAAELQNNIKSLEENVASLQQQGAMLDKLLLKLMQDAKPRRAAAVPTPIPAA